MSKYEELESKIQRLEFERDRQEGRIVETEKLLGILRHVLSFPCPGCGHIALGFRDFAKYSGDIVRSDAQIVTCYVCGGSFIRKEKGSFTKFV